MKGWNMRMFKLYFERNPEQINVSLVDHFLNNQQYPQGRWYVEYKDCSQGYVKQKRLATTGLQYSNSYFRFCWMLKHNAQLCFNFNQIQAHSLNLVRGDAELRVQMCLCFFFVYTLLFIDACVGIIHYLTHHLPLVMAFYSTIPPVATTGAKS